jgi:hypothetical protein
MALITAPSARVMRFARGRSSVSSDFETCCERAASRWLWSRVS